ncbi:MAG TPA: DUF2243 domain-containing protein [Solirubrobacterales bacterium]|nr:DUF2243 domain-containing protein [Solirubrobacterales bacterium]
MRSPLLPAFLLGIGFGGFVDGIFFHEILQWHHILSDEGCCPTKTVAGLEDNTLADGFFHVVTWLFVFAGTILATRAWQQGRLAPPWRLHFGAMLVGWGGFNLVEGLIDHHLLGIHHLRDDLGGPLAWDLGFLAFGALSVLVGWGLIRSAPRGAGPAVSPLRR